jgi:hypothetical protein
MAIRSLKNNTFSRSLLVGNARFVPTSFEKIATFTGTGSSGSISFTSIAADWNHLQLRLYGKADDAVGIYLRFNSDTGSNYAWHRLYGNGSTATAAGYTSQTRIAAIGDFDTTNPFSAVIDILDYKNTNKYKTVRLLSGTDKNGSGSIALYSGLWQNTNAITGIEIYLSAGNYTTATKYALYGIKGA